METDPGDQVHQTTALFNLMVDYRLFIMVAIMNSNSIMLLACPHNTSSTTTTSSSMD
jgi:hypothetical protein